MKKLVGLTFSLMLVASLALGAGETLYESTTNGSAAVTFGPNVFGPVVIKSLSASSDGATAKIKTYVKSGDRLTPSAVATNGATVIAVVNTGLVLTTNDLVVYYHAVSDVVDYRTVSGATASNITLSAGITSAGTASDQLYELAQGGEIDLGTTALNLNGDYLFVSETDSPVRLVVDGGSNVLVQATVTR